MALRQLTEEELLAAARGLNPPLSRSSGPIKAGTPNAEQMTHKRPGPPSDPPPAMPPKAEEKPPHVVRQAPPSVVARKPGPPPAKVAAEKGIAAPPAPIAPAVPRETESAAPAQEKPLDRHAFSYQAQVEAMERKAMDLGRPEEAARVRSEYNKLIDGQFRSMETDYKTKTLPQVQAIQSQLLEYQGKQLPRELVMKARDTVNQAAQQQQQMLGYLYGLARNDATKGLGIQYFNESDLIEPGVKLADLVVKDGMLIGVDAGGQPVNMASGQPFQFPIEAAEQLYRDLFENPKEDVLKLGEGEVAYDRTSGRQIASNPRSPAGTPSEQMTASKQAADVIATEFGAKRDPVSNMIDPDTIKDRPGYTRALAEVEALVRGGMPPLQAADTVAQRFRGAQGATQQTGAAGYSGPLPWRP
jgi:hypothetical protein